MDITVDNNIEKAISVSIGDIVYVENWGFYIIADEESGYIARNPNDWQGLNGYRKTLKLLSESLSDFKITHYPKELYQLEIVKK